MLAEDKRILTYRPSLKPLGKSIIGTMLLSQIIYWDDKCGGEFYKFMSPCDHPKYKEGESWEEDFEESWDVLSKALNGFAVKKSKKNKEKYGDTYKEVLEQALVTYYTDNERITYYTLNRKVLNKLLNGIYLVIGESRITKETPKSRITKETPKSLITLPSGTTSGTTSQVHSDISEYSEEEQEEAGYVERINGNEDLDTGDLHILYPNGKEKYVLEYNRKIGDYELALLELEEARRKL
jgi:hypothetical protein